MKVFQAFFITLCLFVCLEAPIWAAEPVKAMMLVNLGTGKILYEKNSNLGIPPASLTKIMTSFLTMEQIRHKKLGLNQKISIPAQAAKTGGSAMGLSPGERVPVVRLLSGMAVSSGNDAATALALRIGGTEKKFVAAMNKRAAQLGMRNTIFKNPTGLPAAGQKTTAKDMMLLCREYLKRFPEAARFHSIKYFMHKGRVARNTNPLLGTVNGVNGLKTGWTIASGYNLIVTAQRGKTRLMAVLLGGANKGNRDAMAKKLLEAGFRNPGNPAAVLKEMRGY